MKTPRWTTLLLLVALIAAACSGNDSGDGGSDASPGNDDGSGEPTATATGVTEDTIKLGFAYADLEALADQGFVDLDHGPYEDIMGVLVDDLNANGGVGGRQVEMV